MTGQVDIPVIETGRLIMRGHRLPDFDAYAAMWADPIVTRFIGGRARTREESWTRFLRHAGMWHHLGFGSWAIQEKASGRFVGDAGFLEVRRDMTPSLEGTLETGWALVPEAHGKGYATEALRAALAWGRANHPDKAITCITDPGNAASIRVAAKSGFIERGRGEYGGEPVIVFDHRP